MPYAFRSKFTPVQASPRFRTLEDAQRAFDSLLRELNSGNQKLTREFKEIERTAGAAAGSTTIVLSSGGSGSSGGGSVIVNYRAQSASLTAGTSSQYVPFTTPITSSFVLWWRTDDGAGGSPGVLILPTDITANGFTVTDCLADCTIYYGALPLG